MIQFSALLTRDDLSDSQQLFYLQLKFYDVAYIYAEPDERYLGLLPAIYAVFGNKL
jgi:hypothetical protein